MQSTLPQNNRPKYRNVGSLAVLFVTIALSLGLWFNRQLVSDAVSYYTFHPTAAVEEIAARDLLTEWGKFYLYANNPSVDGGMAFNKACANKESGTAILGCYTGDRIYIYKVDDKRLDGIQEVTAAHELLHAVYDRMSDKDKLAINKLVEAEYAKLRDNPQFSKRMEYYARTEPGERDNELHSIIGTEVASISPELEAHYKRYFENRKEIVAFHDAYSSAFTKLADQAKSLEGQMDTLSKQISTQSDTYNADVESLNADIQDFNGRAAKGGFSDQAEFDTERQALEDRVTRLADDRKDINSKIDRFNALRNQYNNIVTQSNDLYKSIDSSLAKTPQV